MKCEECEYRFRCFTLAINERPKKVKVNWRINNTCGSCQYAQFGIKASGNALLNKKAGYCDEQKMIVHKQSAICGEASFKPFKIANVDRIYDELRAELRAKNRKTKLPKYCEVEE